MAIELNMRTKIIAGVGALAIAGAGAWVFLLQDEPAPPAKVAATPAADASKTTAAAKTHAKPAQAAKSASQATAAPDAHTTKEPRPASGKYYSDKELKDLVIACVFTSLSQEERHKPVVALCEQLVKLHEAGKEAEAHEVMWKALELMLASGVLEQEKDDPWQSDIPAKALALNKEGKDLYHKAGSGKATFDAAIEKFKQALAIKSDYYTATRNVAEALSFKGDQQGVEDYYRRALALAEKHNIRDMEFYERFANHLSFRGRLPEAKRILQKGLKLDPNNPRLLGGLGVVHEQQKDFKTAMTYYERAAQGGSVHARERLDELRKRGPDPGQVSSREQLAQTKPRATAGAPAPTKPAAPAQAEKPAAAPRKAPAPQPTPPSVAAPAAAAPTVTTLRFNDLVTAVLYGDPWAVNDLLAFGKWPDKADSRGMTPLMLAAMLGDMASAEALLKAGANPNRPGPGGDTAVSIARERQDAPMQALLQRYGGAR